MSKVLPHSPILIKNSNTLQYDRDLSYSHHCPYLPRHPSSLAPQPSLSHVSLTNEMKVGKSSHQTHNFNQTCRRHIQHFINFKPPPPHASWWSELEQSIRFLLLLQYYYFHHSRYIVKALSRHHAKTKTEMAGVVDEMISEYLWW